MARLKILFWGTKSISIGTGSVMRHNQEFLIPTDKLNPPPSSFYRLQSCHLMSKHIFRESLVPRKQIEWKPKVRSLLAFLNKFTKGRSKLDQLVKNSWVYNPKIFFFARKCTLAPSFPNVGFLQRKLQNLGTPKHHLFHKWVRRESRQLLCHLMLCKSMWHQIRNRTMPLRIQFNFLM